MVLAGILFLKTGTDQAKPLKIEYLRVQVPQLRAAQKPLWRIRCLICQNPLIFCSLPQVVGADVLHVVQGSEETWPCPDSSVHLLQLEQLMPGGGATGPG